MKLTLTPLRQKVAALCVAAIALAIAWFAVVAPIWTALQLHEERLAMLRRQALRLEALAAVGPKYETLARKMSSNADVRALTFVAVQSGVGVADLQATLNRIFSSAGARVSTSQALPDVAGEGLTKISVQTTLEVDIGSLVTALHAIGASRPLLKIEKFTMREPDGEWVNPGRNTANILIVDLVVSARLRRT